MKEVMNEYESLKLIENLKNEFQRGLGNLSALRDAKTINLPLQSVDINAKVVGRTAEVTIKQEFRNPHADHLEAEYIFPLSGCSSVNAFRMVVGSRVVTGTIQERRAAREQYSQALSEGKRASLLEQERDDIFTLQVGNIPPSEKISIELTYSERLEFFEDGTTELRLPLVVAPRYVPGTPVAREQVGDGVVEDTDIVPDASRISPPRLADGVDPNVSLSISVELIPELSPGRDEQGSLISDLSCSQHAIKSSTTNGAIRVTLSKGNEFLNRDFVLQWRKVGSDVMSSVVLFRKDEGSSLKGYAMLSLLPPTSSVANAPARDVVFVVDRSGSMSGQKMVSAARACSILLSTLGPTDRFAINAFDCSCEWFGSRPQLRNADAAAIEEGEVFLRAITARGGTEMVPALEEALTLTNGSQQSGSDSQGQNRVPVIVLLTDGEVGNESQLLKLVQNNRGDSRIFAIGIDTAVNSSILMRMAGLAGGTASFVVPGAELEDALIKIGREIGAPLITELKVESLTSGVTISSFAPERMSDLFAGRVADCLFQADMTSMETGALPRFRVEGRMADGQPFKEEIQAQMVDSEAIPRLWARAYIKELEDQFRMTPERQDELKQKITDLSIDFSVLTRFTAFVAVDETEIVNLTGEVRQVVQPVHMPDQWEMQQQSAMFYNTPQASGLGSAARVLNQMVPRSQAPAPAAPPSQMPIPGSGWGSPDSSSMGGGIARSFFESGTNAAAFSPAVNPPKPQPQADFEQISLDEPTWNPLEESSGKAEFPQKSLRREKADVPARRKPDFDKMRSLKKTGIPAENSLEKPSSERLDIWSTMKKLFASSHTAKSNLPTSPLTRILNALRAFRETWMNAWMELSIGTIPSSSRMEAVTQELLNALADHPVGFDVPLLHRFLRMKAKTFVSALEAENVTASSVYGERSQFHEGFVDAMVQAESAILKVQGRQGAFWESNV